MSDFPYQPMRPRLLDGKLTLDPDIAAKIAEIEADMNARRIIDAMLRPNWKLLLPDFQSIIMTPPSAFSPPSTPSPPPGVPIPYPNAAGPATPRAGELSDVTGAIYKLPAVQNIVTRAHDEGLRQLRVLRNEWQNAPASERAVMVTMSVIVAAPCVLVIATRPRIVSGGSSG